MSETNFYFARVWFPQLGLSDFETESPNDLGELRRQKILEYVNRSEVVFAEADDDAVWRFGQCETEEGYILGKFGKSFTEEQTQWDDEAEDYVEQREEVELADVSHFIVFPDIGGIAFNRKLHIGPKQFIEAFVGGYNQLGEMDGRIAMELLRSGGDKSFSEVAAIASRLRKVEFDLEPTNPYPDEDMAILDDHIHAMNADSFEMEAEVEEDSEEGIDPNEDFIRSGAAMSDVGDYGEYLVQYEDEEGELYKYNSRGEPATEEANEPETVGGLIPIAEMLSSRLGSLLSLESNPDDESE